MPASSNIEYLFIRVSKVPSGRVCCTYDCSKCLVILERTVLEHQSADVMESYQRCIGSMSGSNNLLIVVG